MNDPITDVMGNVIKPGDKVIYAAADGPSAVLRRGVVTKVGWKEADPNYYSKREPQPRVVVEAERLSHNWRDLTKREWKEMDKKITLSFPTRIIVVDSAAW